MSPAPGAAGSDRRAEREVGVVVIGAGPTGENLAQYAHEGGLGVVMVERALVGGECSYHACMPSKALLRPIDVAETSRHLSGVQESKVDVAALLARRDDWVSHYDDAGQVEWARGADIEVVRGSASITGERRVVVEQPDAELTVHARVAIVVATGSVPVVPPVFDGLHCWTSADATGVTEVPGRLVIIGGGVVACEAATWMSALGSQVTMLVRGNSLLARMEPAAGRAVCDALAASGVQVRTGVRVLRASRADARDTGLGRVHGGPVDLLLDAGSDTETLQADEVLVATGRRPALDGLGLEHLGLDLTRLDALPDWLHVIGDADPLAPLTHMGKYQARMLGARLAGQHETPPPEHVPVPQVVFTQPQVATVGLTAAEARARHGEQEVTVSEVPYTSAAGAALLRDDAAGSATLVVDRRTGQVLGATFVGPETAELLHAATIAMVGQVPVGVLRHAVPAYPTASELWLRLLEQLPRELR